MDLNVKPDQNFVIALGANQIFCVCGQLREAIFLLSDPHLVILAAVFLNFRVSPAMLTLNSIVQRDPEVIFSEADQDLIMVSIATGCYYGLSDVAREVWDAIESPKRVSDLVGGLTKSYNVNSSLCEEQTLSFLQTLLDEGLLQVKDGSAG